MISNYKLTKYLKPKLLKTKVYLKNRSPIIRLNDKTLYEAWYKLKLELGHIRIIEYLV